MSPRRRGVLAAIVLVAIGVVPLLQTAPWFRTAENRVFDRMLRVLPEPPVDDRVLVVGIDDRAIELVGEWPWSRSVLADGLAAIGEFAPTSILLDVELSERSPWLVERGRWDRITDEFSEVVPRAVLDSVLVDRDRVLAETIGALGSVYVPVTIEERAGVRVRRAIPQIRDAAAGEGFANLQIDRDGVSRRVELVRQVGDQRWTQLGLAVLGGRLAEPEGVQLDATGSLSGGSVDIGLDDRTVGVPLSPEGEMIVRWPERSFSDSFRQLSWATLIEYRTAMEDLAFNLRLMDQAGYLDERSRSVIQTADAAAETLITARARGDAALFDEYRQLRQAFVALAGGVLRGNTEERILADLESLVADDAPEAVREQIAGVRADVVETFAATRGIYEEVERLREFLDESIPGSFALVGYTATSTIDLGVTPFDESFPNLGLHAAVISMFTSDEFLSRSPWWVSWIAALVWMAVVVFVVERAQGGRALVVALAGVVTPAIVVMLVFRFSRHFVPLISLMAPATIMAVAVLARDYLSALRDRQVIRQTFEHYLAPEVISELVEHPDRLGVGGREEDLTAMFTDIVGFSRVSEILGTAEVVSLLNEYLTEMSDVVTAHRGTIDKYEGDAIMAFFGAPVPDAGHAESACRAAIRMKKVEDLLNDRLVRTGASPQPLVTRIGVNSGSMIVGNLGTTRRLNYTVMGPAVNLASRLEGVNKTYGTAICISETTRNALPEGFLLRRMDRVRVKGIDDPVRLYQLIGYAEEATAPMRESLELFSRGLEAFEAWQWDDALARFETVLRIYADDGPARLFADRCRRFLTEPPRDTWDGVVALTQK